MSSVLDAMEALAARFAGIPGLTCHAWPVGELGAPPALVVSPADGDFLSYTVAMGDGVADAQLTIAVFVQYGEDRSAIAELMPYLADTGSQSVYAIVAADPTLGGVVDSALVQAARGFGPYTYGAARYLGVEFPVEVYLS